MDHACPRLVLLNVWCANLAGCLAGIGALDRRIERMLGRCEGVQQAAGARLSSPLRQAPRNAGETQLSPRCVLRPNLSRSSSPPCMRYLGVPLLDAQILHGEAVVGTFRANILSALRVERRARVYMRVAARRWCGACVQVRSISCDQREHTASLAATRASVS